MILPTKIAQLGMASVISFALGTASGAVTSYVGVRNDLAALTARTVIAEQRITSLEQAVSEMREDEARSASDLASQIHAAVDILTDLRIRIGPEKRR